MDFIEGEVLYINKPLYWTSFKVVDVVRAKICERLKIKKLKVGHAGTLDPLATGVMIVCTGKKTKEIERFQAQTKEYMATIRLGATTPSFDLETPIDAMYPIHHITEEMVNDCLLYTSKMCIRDRYNTSPSIKSIENQIIFEIVPVLNRISINPPMMIL